MMSDFVEPPMTASERAELEAETLRDQIAAIATSPTEPPLPWCERTLQTTQRVEKAMTPGRELQDLCEQIDALGDDELLRAYRVVTAILCAGLRNRIHKRHDALRREIIANAAKVLAVAAGVQV